MLIRNVTLTDALARWLRESHDDEGPELDVTPVLPFEGIPLTGEQQALFIIRRLDGTEPSPTERREINARLAAHAVEPLR